MSWHSKLLPRPRWLPRAVLMHPQRVVVIGFALVMLLMLVLGVRDLYLLRERVLSTRQHDLALRALGVEAVFAAERFKLTFMRDYAQQLIAIQQSRDAAPSDAAIEQAFAARNEPVWQMPVPLGDSPVIGVSPDLLNELEGFDRHDADLRADLYAARQLSHLLGLSQRDDDTGGSVSFISNNGLYVTYPPLPADKAPALMRRFSDIAYYRDVLPDRDAGHDIRWAPVYTQFESTQLRTTLSIPVYVAQRFRGVVAVDVQLPHLRELIGTPDEADSVYFLIDRRGSVIASSQHHVRIDLHWPGDVDPMWRNIPLQALFDAGSGMRHGDGKYLFFQAVGNRGNWLMLDTLTDRDLYSAVLQRSSGRLLAIWLALPLLMFVTLRVVTLLFRHYLAAGEKLQHLAESDPLTGLANRRHFGDAFMKESARRQRDGKPLAMLVLDLDYFKRVNDRWGHAGGDLVLVAMAGVLRGNLRETDLPARLGGEEFAVLLPGTSRTEAAATAERLRAAAEATAVEPAADASPPDMHDGRIRFTVSIGVAEAGIDACPTFDGMLATADRRLYAAKAAGRNRVCVSDVPADNAAAPPVRE